MKISFANGLPDNPGIAIVAVSGCALDGVAVERGLRVLRERGFLVHNYYEHAQIYQRFGATDSERLAQLNAAIDNPDVQIIMALRGSYGLSRLLPHIDYQKLADSKKYLIGYSDFNALQLAMLAKTGTSSFCGPMLCDDFSREDLSAFTLGHFFECINHRSHQIQFEAVDNADIDVSGTLWGGNLAMLTHLVGSEYFPDIRDGILFVEDIAEHPYRVERMLLQLHFAGVLNRQKAIVFGDFSAYKLAVHDNGYDFDQMLAYLRSVLTVPLITGLPFGHIKDKATLVTGSQARLSSLDGAVSLVMDY
ncbi:muramoyltetrapeptide carboxypeptidase [Undibacterium sp. Ren11W]|uniref:muramoyltetrapeptide carboxypeptidase n=1 Tax=Undibacterium sp. Ren11W TaxID=3413045 RepID=UPI003BF271E7